MKGCMSKKGGEFRDKVRRIVKGISRGKMMTYKQVAALAGRPRAYRAVGNILSANFDPKIPCHRVICSDGKTGGYNRGAGLKIRRLRSEGAIL